MRRQVCALLIAVLLLGAAVAPAFAYREPRVSPDPNREGCYLVCHKNADGSFVNFHDPEVHADCVSCHAPFTHGAGDFPFGLGHGTDYVIGLVGGEATQGPHGRYNATTNRCSTCHSLHAAVPGSYKLLPGTSLTGSCFACHDGTGGGGVYGTIKVRTGADPAGGHPVVSTSTVPGGNASTGGSSTVTFGGTGGALTCSDCHSPHGNGIIQSYKGDRLRVNGGMTPSAYSARLLKQRPTGSDTAVTVYGSDWCMACHKGRPSGGAVHNHPVDSYLITSTPLYYNNIVITDHKVGGGFSYYGGYGPLGGGENYSQTAHFDEKWSPNTGYLMPYPRLPRQVGHAPICQQCHEDTRDPGTLSADGTDAIVATSTETQLAIDGTQVPGKMLNNPRFQNFPHETETDKVLIETGDDLCLNCHPAVALP